MVRADNDNTRDDMYSARTQCGHTELRCELRVISGQLACAHAVWEDVTAKLFVSHVKESCLMLQRTSTNYLWFRHGISKQLVPHKTKTSSVTRQGNPQCSLRQGRCNLAVVLRQCVSQWAVAPLIFDGGVGARHQQDPDDGDVPVSGAILVGPACRCSTFWCRRYARAARAPSQRTLEGRLEKEVRSHHSSLLCHLHATRTTTASRQQPLRSCRQSVVRCLPEGRHLIATPTVAAASNHWCPVFLHHRVLWSRLGELLMKPRAPDEADGGLLPLQHAQPGQLLKVAAGVELLGALMHGSGRQEHGGHLSGGPVA